MPIKLECPRCKQSLAVPNRKAGGYANCPRCKGRFWVPEDAVDDPALAESPGLSSSRIEPPAPAPAAPQPYSAPSPVYPPVPPAYPAAPPVYLSPPPAYAAAPPVYSPPPPASVQGPVSVPFAPAAPPPPLIVVPPSVQPPSSPPAAAPFHAPPPPAVALGAAASHTFYDVPPPSPAPYAASSPSPLPIVPPVTEKKKVARFITAEAAQSTIQPNADGKLPGLQLDERQAADGNKNKGATVRPMTLVAVLAASVIMSVTLAFMGSTPEDPAARQRKEHSRQEIRDTFFTNINKPLAPYQIYLRQADQAHASGDYQTERKLYLKVLNMLRGVPDKVGHGVTGSTERDKELEDDITDILSDQ